MAHGRNIRNSLSCVELNSLNRSEAGIFDFDLLPVEKIAQSRRILEKKMKIALYRL